VFCTQGSGSNLIQPVLDNQLAAASKLVLPERDWITRLPLDRALDLVKDAFVSAGERDIYTVRRLPGPQKSLRGSF